MKKSLLLSSLFLSFGALNAQVVDGGFEAGIGAGTWVEASTSFGTPLCDLATCGNGGGGAVAASGSVFAWFGGNTGVETGSVQQVITIPNGTVALLTVQVKIPSPGPGLAADRLEVSIDGNVLATVTALDSVTYSAYAPLVVNVSAMADGGTHTLRIEGFQTTATVFSILADDVVLSVDGVVLNVFDFENEVSNVSVYPNPANEQINMDFGSLEGSASVSIISVDGTVVAQRDVNDVFGKTLTFTTEGLSNGVYIVQVINNGVVSTERIVISK